jgi:hypothetical protein
MQKVEGSNPFSRFEKGLYLQAFFACAVGLCICVGPRSENRICCCAASLLSVLLFPLSALTLLRSGEKQPRDLARERPGDTAAAPERPQRSTRAIAPYSVTAEAVS